MSPFRVNSVCVSSITSKTITGEKEGENEERNRDGKGEQEEKRGGNSFD